MSPTRRCEPSLSVGEQECQPACVMGRSERSSPLSVAPVLRGALEEGGSERAVLTGCCSSRREWRRCRPHPGRKGAL